ncbi:MAG TPA: FG-GAP-like repeat-containing protein [Gemmata sp.]
MRTVTFRAPRSGTKPGGPVLRLEALEARDVPAITIQLDYSYDTGFFASHPDAVAILNRVASELGNSLTANLAAITPSAGNTWTATAFNPSGTGQITVPNLSVGANTLKVFVGAKAMSNNEQGVGGPGGYSLSGSSAWISTVQTRGHNGYSPWGGSLSFDSNADWYFGADTTGLGGNKIDFYSVVTHEMGHLLGIGTSTLWTSAVSGGTYTGANARAVYGGPVPVTADGAHWADGVTVSGAPVSLDPILPRGTRVNWSALDAAALRDLGWNTIDAPAASPPVARVPLGNQRAVAFTGNTDGTVSLFTSNNGVLTDTGTRLTPFVGYLGAIRVASGDFNGDGVLDYAFTTGAGPQTVVKIVNGADGSALVGEQIVFPGFRGGLFLAAADINRDGADDLVISADAGAGPHIQTFRIVSGNLVLQSSFFAFDNPAYRGGARVSAGDLNRDGFADVVVTTGGQAEGRVAIYSGADLRNGTATRLFPDFNPFAGLWAGLNAAVGDMNGDGFAELAVTPDRGGPAHVKIWSGATLSANPGVLASNLPLTASFYGLPPTDLNGARLALRDTNSDGRAELFVASGNPRNSIARSYTYEMALAGGQGASDALPFGTTLTYDGVYVGLHTPAPTDTADATPQTVTLPAFSGKCTCGACAALAQLVASATGAEELVSTIPV